MLSPEQRGLMIHDTQNLTFIGIVISLFLILNATGQIPLFVSLLSPFDHKRQKKIIIRELFIALGLLLLFDFFGNEILTLLGISKSIIGIAGGILLFLISLEMIFPKEKSVNGVQNHEPMVIPLAIPAIAGPGSITMVMLYAHELHSDFLVAAAIIVAWIPSLLILLLSSYIKNFLGEKGLMAVEKLGGMIVCLIGIQMFASGVMTLIKENFSL